MPSRVGPVSDLIIRFGHGSDPGGVADRLRGRPGLEQAHIHSEETPWGRVWIQRAWGGDPTDRGISGLVLVGRPTVRAAFRDGPVSAEDWVTAAGGLGDGRRVGDALSGMFAAFEIGDAGVRVLTDRMGFRPVYVVRDRQGRIAALGTDAEGVAMAGGVSRDLDEVSIAELLIHNYITFPHTTRLGMTELTPASLTTIDARGGSARTEVLWEPTEPSRFPDATTMHGRIIASMREAAADLTTGCERVGVLLSGGIDSRAVLGAMPDGVNLAALTYVTRENNETRIAAKLAAIAGAEPVTMRRGEDYFPRMLRRGLSLLGCELRGNCHGLCLADAGLCNRFDAIVGGQLSDTFLKDHFMDAPSRMRARPASLGARLRRLVRGHPADRMQASRAHTTGRHLQEHHLTPEMQRRVAERRERRLEEVRRVRPTTAAIWTRFWPCSRQDDSAHTLGNARIAWGDTLFAHTAVVEAARDLSPECRVGGRVANRAFAELCGPLASVENANTGLPIDADPKALQKLKKERRLSPKPAAEIPAGDTAPWNAVEGSWVNPIVMQQRSGPWRDARAALAGSPALTVLDRVIARGGATLIGAYQDDLPSNINHIGVQIGLWLDGVLRSETPECVGQAAEKTA